MANPKIVSIYRLDGRRGVYKDLANLPKLKRWYASLAKPKRLESGGQTTREGELQIQSSRDFQEVSLVSLAQVWLAH